MRRSKWFKGSVTLPILLVVPAAILFVAATILTVYAFTNPSQTPPGGTAGPIAVTMGGTQATTTSQALLNLGAAASGANTDITSLSPSGNLIISPTGGVGIGTTSLGTGALVTVNGNLVANGELQSTLGSGSGQVRMIAGNYGAIWRNDGTNTYLLFTNSGSQYGTWNSLRPLQINDSTGNIVASDGINMNNSTLTGLPAPVNASDAATKAYVDAAGGGLNVYQNNGTTLVGHFLGICSASSNTGGIGGCAGMSTPICSSVIYSGPAQNYVISVLQANDCASYTQATIYYQQTGCPNSTSYGTASSLSGGSYYTDGINFVKEYYGSTTAFTFKYASYGQNGVCTNASGSLSEHYEYLVTSAVCGGTGPCVIK